MKFLEEIDRCCKANYVRRFLRDANGSDSPEEALPLISKFYNLLHLRQYSEMEIVKKLYGKSATPSYPPFRTLKTRLRRIMTDAFLLQELKRPSFRNYDDAYLNGYAQLNVVRMLVLKKAYTAARDIASQTFANVRKFEIIPLNVGLTEVLAACHLAIFYQEDLYIKYRDLNTYYSQAAFDLSKVTRYYREVRNGIYAQRDAPLAVGQLALKYVNELVEIGAKYPHISQIQGMIISTQMTGYILSGDYQAAIDASEQGLKKLKQCQGVSQKTLSVISLSMVDCSIKLGNFKMGEKHIAATRKHVQPGTINDLKLSDYSILLGLRTGHYEFAYRTFAQVSRRKINSLLTRPHIEYWGIIEAYLNLLITAGEVIPKDHWPSIRAFKLTKFLNQVPTTSGNKQGANIQLLILQAVFFIVRGRYARVIDRTEALSAYCNRYLKNDENLRNNCFFRLLLTAIQCNFNRPRTIEKSKTTLKKLQLARSNGDINDLELIPYEKLWEIVLNHLVNSPKSRSITAKATA